MIVNQCDLSVTADVPVMGAEVSEDTASVQNEHSTDELTTKAL